MHNITYVTMEHKQIMGLLARCLVLTVVPTYATPRFINNSAKIIKSIQDQGESNRSSVLLVAQPSEITCPI